MAIRRGTVTPKAIYRGSTPVQKVYRGSTLVWSADPLTHWAKLESPDLSVNSGSAGGTFSQVGTVAARTPGAWIPSGSYMHSPAGGWGAGFTVAAWIKTTKSGNEAPLGISATGGGMYFMHNASGDGKIAALINIDGQTLTLTSSVSVTMSSWVHVALVVWPDGNTANLWHGQMFLDGSSAAYGTINGAGAPPSASTLTLGGATPDAAGSQWEGDLDEARLYLAPLNATQIAAIFDAEVGEHLIRYTGTYSGGQVQLAQNAETSVLYHAVTSAGIAVIAATVVNQFTASGYTYTTRIRINGIERAVASGNPSGSNKPITATSAQLALSAGDEVTVTATATAVSSSYRKVASSTLTFT